MKRYLLLLIILVSSGCAATHQANLVKTQAVTWGDVQTAADQASQDWDWSGIDTMLAEHKGKLIVPIYPYALWDQATCHTDWPSKISIFGPNFQAPYPPCDQAAYTRWITALVERYPQVEAWQIVSAPTDQDPPTAQWIGGAQSYAELAIVTAEAIHAADHQAQVYVGELQNLDPTTITFYTELLSREDVQTKLDGLTLDAETVADHSVVESLLDRANWDRPAYWVYTKS